MGCIDYSLLDIVLELAQGHVFELRQRHSVLAAVFHLYGWAEYFGCCTPSLCGQTAYDFCPREVLVEIYIPLPNS